MNAWLYKATGMGITAAIRLLRIRVRVSGVEQLPDRPILFVVNHFTRIETFLIPYVIYQRFQRPVRSLATSSIFHGLFARYLNSVGVLSVRHPRRNRIIIGELMTGRIDWVIYPEGGLIKNRKTIRKGRLHLHRPDRSGPPHTGAALLALRAEIIKRRYLELCHPDDEQRRGFYEQQYDLRGPEDLREESTLIVPVNITYHGVKPGRSPLLRVARMINKELDPRLEEELTIEGAILFGDGEISVNFGEPIEVERYINRGGLLLRRLVGRFREERANEVQLRAPARRLMSASVRSIYNGTEVSFEHLFCYALRLLPHDLVPMRQLKKALCLTIVELRSRNDVRLHPILRNGVTALAAGDCFEPLEDAVERACREGVLRCEDGVYVIDRAVFAGECDFHEVRLKRMTQVLANELEPIEPAVQALRRTVSLTESQLDDELSRRIGEGERTRFHELYAQWHDPEASRNVEFGEPYLLHPRRFRDGVLLVHGYLGCPAQVRPLAEHLRDAGYAVYAVRLEGHGTAPRHLNDVTWQEWMHSLNDGFSVLRPRCRRIVVGGFSLGGILSLIFAGRRGAEVGGVFSINAPMHLRDPRFPLVSTVVTAADLLQRLRVMRDEPRRSRVPESPDLTYPEDFLRGVREVKRAVQACRRVLPMVEAPALIIQAENDPLVSPRSADLLKRGLGSVVKAVAMLPSDRHLIIEGDESAEVFRRIETFLTIVSESADPSPATTRTLPANVSPFPPVQP